MTAASHDGRRALIPAGGVPIVYFAFAHICLGAACATFVVRPDLPAGFFHHPRMIAVVHLVTLGWITASILGAFYIVGPLALRLPLRATWRDHVACACFMAGVIGMVAHFWVDEYSGMAWSAALVAAAVLHVGVRAWAGLPRAPVPWPVKLHVALAFANIMLASAFGTLIGLNRLYGWFAWSPISTAFAHAHLAAVGWAVMMVVGLSYRLIPMIVPAEMPNGRAMAMSAVLLEIGTIGLAIALVARPGWSLISALIIVGGIASFVGQVTKIVKRKLPRLRRCPGQTGRPGKHMSHFSGSSSPRPRASSSLCLFLSPGGSGSAGSMALLDSSGFSHRSSSAFKDVCCLCTAGIG